MPRSLPRAFRLLPCASAKPLVVDRLEREVERRVVVADVVLQRDRRLVGELVRLDEVLAPDLDPVDAQLARGLVDQALEQVGRLGPARRRGTASTGTVLVKIAFTSA